MTEFTREIMYGKRPVRRTQAEPGQSEWYYLDPRGSDSFEEMKQIDVPSEDTPNPFADEIQNYLYNNDEYNYKQLYGDTPPPTQITATPWIDNSLTEAQRIQALKNGETLNLYIGNSQNADYEWPWYTINWLGKYYVDKHNNDIEKYAAENNINPNLVKAVMYNEAATGHKGILNYLGDVFGWSNSQMPMNIQGKTWGNFEGTNYNTNIPQQNIELGIKVLKQMQNSLNQPTPDRIGTLWNETGANNINSVGARVKTAYDTKPWLGEKQWEQKALELFWKTLGYY